MLRQLERSNPPRNSLMLQCPSTSLTVSQPTTRFWTLTTAATPVCFLAPPPVTSSLSSASSSPVPQRDNTVLGLAVETPSSQMVSTLPGSDLLICHASSKRDNITISIRILGKIIHFFYETFPSQIIVKTILNVHTICDIDSINE